jgi:hypothetical protein
VLKTTLSIPASGLPVLQSNLPGCPGVQIGEVEYFNLGSTPYCCVHLSYTNNDDLAHLGFCVALAEEGGQTSES